MDTMQKVYLDAQAACGLKVGDWVKVVREAKDEECGWDNAWGPAMGCTVGRTGRVVDMNNYGVRVHFEDPVNDWWRFPYFVLERVDKPVHEFKPFERVLVRDDNEQAWRCDFFSHPEEGGPQYGYMCVGACWEQCIPYEGNEHLLGTTDAPEESC